MTLQVILIYCQTLHSSETNPFVIDAYLMLQDIVMLIGADQPIFMTGIVEMTRTFGLELLESLLTKFPAVFEKHDQVTPLETRGLSYKIIAIVNEDSILYRRKLPPILSELRLLY